MNQFQLILLCMASWINRSQEINSVGQRSQGHPPTAPGVRSLILHMAS